MPRAKSELGRLKQVERWLLKKFPLDRKVRVVVGRVNDAPADIRRESDCYVIRFDTDALARWGEEMTESLLHEWAHAYVWRKHLEADASTAHDAEWGVAYAAIYSAFFDKGGRRASMRFSSKPWG
jgi:hypothetical protein